MNKRFEILTAQNVDPAPTAADFARRIWDVSEIRPEYRRYLDYWIRSGISLEHVIFAPQPKYQPGIREYMLAYFEEELMMLEYRQDGRVEQSVIKRSDVLCFCSTENLLKGCITIYWGKRSDTKKTEISYNRVRKELFLPVLDWLTGCVEGFDCREAGRSDTVPTRFRQEQPALYNYSMDVYRFGTRCYDWNWWELKAAGFFKRKQKPNTACLLCKLEKGQVLFLLCGQRVDIWYLFWESSLATVKAQGKNLCLTIRAKKEVIEERAFRRES